MTRGGSGAQQQQQQQQQHSYLPGSIIRVKVTNFVTFDAVEFHPGPNLNFLIGPNGSGKSTLVSAICLGLGGKPSILNKDKKLNAFVKIGAERATIEVEIKGRQNEPNPVLRREFGSDDNTSQWFLNNTLSTERKILELVGSYDIQVGNLCQFLPQDRVYDFVRMSPEEIFKETQKAAGDANMFSEHEDLIKLCAEESTFSAQFGNEREQLELLERRNASLEPEVQRFRQREETNRRLNLCNQKHPWLVYEQDRQRYLDTKARRVELRNEFDAFQKENQPLRDELAAKEAQRKELEKSRKEISDKAKGMTKVVDDTVAKIEQQESIVNDLWKEMSTLNETYKRKQREVEDKEREISRLIEQLSTMSEPDLGPLNAKLKKLNESLAQNENEIEQIQADMRDVQQKMDRFARERHDKEKELRQLDDVGRQRLDTLRGVSDDTYQAVMWLRQHANEFSGKVYEPPCLLMNVKNTQYASEVEAAMSFNHMTAFIVETTADQAKLHDQLSKMRLRFAIYTLPQRPTYAPTDEMRRLAKQNGFDGFIVDFVDAPDAIKAMLCEHSHIHQIPVAKQAIDLTRVSDSFQRYFVKGLQYSVTRSMYGNKGSILSQDSVRPARLLNVNTGANVERKQQCEQQIAELSQQMSELERQRSVLDGKDAEVRKVDTPLRREKAQINDQKTKLNAQIKEIQSIRLALEMSKKQLARLQEELRRTDIATQEAELKRRINKETKKRTELAVKAASMHCEIRAIYVERAVLNITVSELEAVVAKLKREVEEKTARLQQMQAEITRVETDERTLKDKAKAALDKAKEAGQPDQDNREEFDQLPARLDELEVMIGTLEATLRIATATSDSVIKEYEDRKKEIERLKITVNTKEAELKAKRERLEELKRTWAPRVEALIARISKAFSEYMERLKNLGEVQLEQHQDYAKWRVKIMVKFRQVEQLAVLDPQRHSGGERTVSTILYLMALQEMARSPFRLVDEINQGMDKHNERAVHHEIVSTATRENTSQYFLVTPKLLTALDYNDKMKVHCVHNGPYQPTHEHWSLEAFLQRQRQAIEAA